MELRAGQFRMMYQEGSVRHLCYGDTEILRMIYFAFRDENWGTLEKIEGTEKIVVEKKSFSLHYTCYHSGEGQRIFRWEAALEGSSSGELIFTLEGTALKAIKTNRAGLCVLHPIRETSGAPVEITRPDSWRYAGTFPVFVEPNNPLIDIKVMKWQCDHQWYLLEFEGEVFETEDQRNWTDASFKTYCTPLAKPFPVLLEKGQKIRQRIVFKPARVPVLKQPEDSGIVFSLSGESLSRLKAGTVISGFPQGSDATLDELRRLPVDFCRIDITRPGGEWKESLGLKPADLPKIELAVHADHFTEQETDDLLHSLVNDRMPVEAVVFLPKDPGKGFRQLPALITRWKERYPSLRIGLGTDYNFAEVNRNRISSDIPDFFSYGIHPQEHAFDDLSLIENLEAQADTVRTIKHIYGNNCGVRVSPVTLRKRFNPYATDPARRVIPQARQIDSRQYTSFGAVWTLGSIRHLSSAGAGSAAFYQGIGKLGLLSEDLERYPVYKALALYHSSAPSLILESASSRPLLADGLFFDDGSAIVWNYTDTRQEIVLPDGHPISLAPYEFRKIMVQKP